ncbi:MAG: phosphoribosyltransferase [Gaiellaceae bacterium]
MNAGKQRSPFLFLDRRDAGAQLARALAQERTDDAVVVGLARGGVVVAAAVASALELPLDGLAVRKVRHPRRPEYALGAVSPNGDVFLLNNAGLTPEQLAAAVAAAEAAAVLLEEELHHGAAVVPLRGRKVLLVDDGFATGATMVAAIRWARNEGSRRVVAAAPIGAAQTVELLAREADRVVCPYVVEQLIAVGIWYADFRQVSDQEVVRLLGSERGRRAASSLLLRTG